MSYDRCRNIVESRDPGKWKMWSFILFFLTARMSRYLSTCWASCLLHSDYCCSAVAPRFAIASADTAIRSLPCSLTRLGGNQHDRLDINPAARRKISKGAFTSVRSDISSEMNGARLRRPNRNVHRKNTVSRCPYRFITMFI